MIPLPVIVGALLYVLMGLNAAACIYGYSQLGKNDTRGHGLMALGSAGWALAAPNTFFLLQSIFFLWVAARGYQKCYRKSLSTPSRGSPAAPLSAAAAPCIDVSRRTRSRATKKRRPKCAKSKSSPRRD